MRRGRPCACPFYEATAQLLGNHKGCPYRPSIQAVLETSRLSALAGRRKLPPLEPHMRVAYPIVRRAASIPVPRSGGRAGARNGRIPVTRRAEGSLAIV